MVDLSTTPLIPLAPDSQTETIPSDSRGIGAALDTPLNTETLQIRETSVLRAEEGLDEDALWEREDVVEVVLEVAEEDEL